MRRAPNTHNHQQRHTPAGVFRTVIHISFCNSLGPDFASPKPRVRGMLQDATLSVTPDGIIIEAVPNIQGLEEQVMKETHLEPKASKSWLARRTLVRCETRAMESARISCQTDRTEGCVCLRGPFLTFNTLRANTRLSHKLQSGCLHNDRACHRIQENNTLRPKWASCKAMMVPTLCTLDH